MPIKLLNKQPEKFMDYNARLLNHWIIDKDQDTDPCIGRIWCSRGYAMIMLYTLIIS